MGTVHELTDLDLHSMGVKVVAVDFGGVMADFIDSDTLSLMARLARVPLERFEIPYWERRDSLDCGTYDAHTYFRHVLADCGSPVKDEKTLDLLFTIDILGFSRLRPRMVGWVCDMRNKGIGTVLVSNMAEETYDRLVHDTHWANSCFDRFVISGILGVNKPDEPIFHHTLRLMQVAPEQVFFIDDSKPNIETAKSMGMQTFHYHG